MIKELWSTFPHLLEERINSLLDEAEPSPLKAFQLYKTLQRESLWDEEFEKFNEHLCQFFSIPKTERRKSHFDIFLSRPMSVFAFESFDLDFRSASINEGSLLNLSSWAHHLLRLGGKTESAIASSDTLYKTLHYVTHPPLFEKAKNITFDDFCEAWKKIVFKLFGNKHDNEFKRVLSELHWLYSQHQDEQTQPTTTERFCPSIYLTQTEIDWTEAVLRATQENEEIPRFPLSRGPEKQRLIDLNRTISLYKIVQKSKLEDFSKHRENIRLTILDRCENLLKQCAR